MVNNGMNAATIIAVEKNTALSICRALIRISRSRSVHVCWPDDFARVGSEAISHVFTIRRAAQILVRDEDLLWELSDQLEPEDGKLWVYAIDGAETPAFTHDGIEALCEIIKIDRAG